ncbi:MAG: nucleotide exchange factor GrpE [Deltaproteobacteria bacterium HGW-Deltaproteobacteria-17]|nr:MAG: nucleotide exchange factor GrpE [Deltaproteobacteria bacterium HGW-Deltaproteobacteria-17]
MSGFEYFAGVEVPTIMNHEDISPTPDLPEKDGVAAETVPVEAPGADTAPVAGMMEEDFTGVVAGADIPVEIVAEEVASGGGEASDVSQEDMTDEPTQTNGNVFDALGARVTELEHSLAEEKSHRLRVLADLDNWRKRSARDLANAVAKAQSDVVIEFLPVLDNLELALEHARENAGIEGMREGVAMVLKQFRSTLTKFGIQEIDASGQAFDPAFHEAMAQNPSDEVPTGMIVKQWQKGFMLGDRLIRPCRVVVSSGPGPSSEKTPVVTSEE